MFVQAGQFPLGPMKVWRELIPLWCRTVRITTRLLSECLGVCKEVARHILKGGLRKIWLRFVPHSLPAEREEYGWMQEKEWGRMLLAVSSNLFTKLMTCCEELWLAMKVGILNSIPWRNNKVWNGVERILRGTRNSGCKNRVSGQCWAFLFFMLPELSTACLFLKAPLWTVII